MNGAPDYSRSLRRLCGMLALFSGILSPMEWQSWAADGLAYAVTIKPTGIATIDAPATQSAELIQLRAKAPVGGFALIARARGDIRRLDDVLHSQGYYDGSVTVSIDGRSIDDPNLADALDSRPAGAAPVQVTVTLTPGSQFHLGQINVAGDVPPADRARLGLTPGQPALAADVLAAGSRLEAALKEDGHALAKVAAPVATLVPASKTLDVTFPVTPGPRVDLGPITVSGLKEVHPGIVYERLPIHQGELYSTSKLQTAQNELTDLGVFSSVRLQPTTSLDAQGQLPIQFIVAERPRHAVNLTGAYSTDLGPTVSASWKDRNLFGNAEQLTVTAASSAGGTAERNPGYSLTGQFIKPDFLARHQSLQIDLGAIKQSLLAYDQVAVTGDVLLNRKFSRTWSGSIGIAAEQEQIKQQGTTRDFTLVGIPVGANYDNTDSLLDPTHGVRMAVSVTPTESLGHRDTTFVIGQAGASTYFDLAAPGRTVLAFRGLFGEVLGASQFQLPPDKRFYAGGSATVRGYRYQSVGPRFPDQTPEGGVSIAAGTIELRQRIGQQFGVAGFVDAGQVSANRNPFEGGVRVGAGLGGRYYSPIGPLRVDIAVPLNRQPKDDLLELYIGIGQAF
jgi:translocation and assembly module TamA